MITEWELECALSQRFDLLLPDLHEQGYRIQRQAMLRGISRRMDIVLSRPDHAWIIELKRGSPDVTETTKQILDYQVCWKAARPGVPVSLMVIGTEDSKQKRRSFAENEINYRAVPIAKILDVLLEGQSTERLGRCNRLPTGDEGKIRFLLCNFAHTEVPKNMRFGPPWSHDSVFYALIRDGREHKKCWLKNIYVKLLDHKPNCAVLYHSEADNKDGAPLHINPRAKSWPTDGWLLNSLVARRAIEHVTTDQKGPGRESVNFDHYKILDWNRFAKVLQLQPYSNKHDRIAAPIKTWSA